MAHCIVKEAAPKRLILAEPIASGHEEGVFKPERNAIAVNFFPFVRGGRAHWDREVADVAILDLVLDGNLKVNPGPWRDFTLAAIHFANVSDSLVRGVTVRGSVGDGIGVQAGRDNRVESCLVESCRGHGLHPGTSLRGATFANNISRRNDGDGLYFCWEVVGITVTGNLFHDNAGHGIGGIGEGGKGGDRFNVVANNICRRNARHGIEAVRGANNVITGNVCLDNSQAKPGQFTGIHLADTTHTIVSGNRCGSEGDKPAQKLGIEECGKSDHNVVAANLCDGNAQGGIAIVGKNTQATGNVGTLVRDQGR
jgi:parallel beta-helix repeat protein